MPTLTDYERLESMRHTLEDLAAWTAKPGESVDALLQSVKDEARAALKRNGYEVGTPR